MNFRNIDPVEDGLLNVIIETVRGSQNKFNYDPAKYIFKLNKTLPMGTVFPFDFGFVPNTRAEDGDPIDVLVIMEQTAFPGCLIQCQAAT
jgi:inorganic pyrophosphatase